jgi:hypothetical protein
MWPKRLRQTANVTSIAANTFNKSIAQKRGIVKDCLRDTVAFFHSCVFFVMFSALVARRG